jgi:acyl dehydratase
MKLDNKMPLYAIIHSLSVEIHSLEEVAKQQQGTDMHILYFEDFHVGDVFDLGSTQVTEEEIIAFARKFDPQPFHLDPELAKDSIFHGLAASGWHTAALFMRLLADGLLRQTISIGSPGVDELRWRTCPPWRPAASPLDCA